MIEPDRSVVELDLGDKGAPLKLWYTPGAIRVLCRELQINLPLSRIDELMLHHLKPETLGIFIWAGLLWEDRKADRAPIEDRLEWPTSTLRPLLDLTHDVTRAVYLGLTGKDLDKLEKNDEGPQKPAEKSGNGMMPNVSPSAISDSQ